MKFNDAYNYTKDLNIIYCEDDSDVLYELSEIFDRFFNSVDRAVDGRDALKKYKKYYKMYNRYYDIVVTDIRMPHMDGIELVKEIKKIEPKQLILVISAYTDSKEVIKLLNMGINYFLHKPIDFDNIINVLYEISKKAYGDKQLIQSHKNTLETNVLLEQLVKEKTKELYEKLYFDILTGLPKRNKLMEDIDKYYPKGLLLINIKEFKNINGVYGSKIGDQVLKKFSLVLKALSIGSCKLYSLGGDEFVIINIKKEFSSDECLLKAIEIISYIDDHPVQAVIDHKKVDIYLSIIIGISTDGDNILGKADLALKYAYKKRLPYAKYSEELNLVKNSKDNLIWTKKIKKALNEDRVVPFFQPIVTNNGKVKYESLIRIIEKDKHISPYYFLKVSKKSGLYNLLTRVMIEKTFKIFSNRDESFSVNLTYEDISDSKLIGFLIDNIIKYKVQGRFIVEILESESIDDFEIVKNFIKVMKRLDVSISIDDFGSGYSNFIYLTQIEPDFIKIDGSIIKQIDRDETSYKIAQTIIDFSKKLGINTIAEYVHSKAVYDKLKSMGISGFQGYYFSEPLENIDTFIFDKKELL
ncbi:MAG: GGDEF domain-containing response regulator [Campylobacterota bacterium]|nr:GGDEF domain-containing response regulator [Campylobacterota bacterium]